jgi:EAL domain-containing protein (putative c-di-GMP-specific phosphodiesterase class I)
LETGPTRLGEDAVRRWRLEQRQLLTRADFIRIAEETQALMEDISADNAMEATRFLLKRWTRDWQEIAATWPQPSAGKVAEELAGVPRNSDHI